jgi:predicted RNase H-like HicB family nuclease
MNISDRYPKLVEWSDEDGCFVGTCPGLMLGGCHGDDARQVFDELIEIIDEVVAIYLADGTPLPEPRRLSELAVP